MKRSNPAIESRSPLNRERVLHVAMALADERGAGALSMRALGDALGVEAMSLYNHVSNKDDLLDGLVDLVRGEFRLPGGDAGWRSAVRGVAISVHDALCRHRWAITVMQTRTTAGPHGLRYHDSMLRTLREAGFSIKQATHAFSVLDSYLFGFALQQLTMPFDTSQELAAAAQGVLDQFPAAEYPYLAETISEHVTKGGYDYADEFEVGLDLILDGIERLLDGG